MIKVEDNKLIYEPNIYVDIIIFRNKNNIDLTKFFDSFNKKLIHTSNNILKLVFTEDENYQSKFEYIIEYCSKEKLKGEFALQIQYCHVSDVSAIFYFSSKNDLSKILLNLPM